MANEPRGKRIAFLAADGVEQVELTEPREAVKAVGGEPQRVSPQTGRIQAVNGMDKADAFPVDRAVDALSSRDYDALAPPGGAANPDEPRMDPTAVAFVRDFFEDAKPAAAICHAPWMLVEADVVRGRTLASYPSPKTDIRNAGGTWVDAEAKPDRALVTSRNPHDLLAFCRKMVEEFAAGRHHARPTIRQSSRAGSSPRRRSPTQSSARSV